MSAKSLLEYDGKRIVCGALGSLELGSVAVPRMARIDLNHSKSVVESIKKIEAEKNLHSLLEAEFERVETECSWVRTTRLAAKPDQLIKRRGKAGLVLLDADWSDVKKWISEKANQKVIVDGVEGILTSFVVEVHVPHGRHQEYYLCIRSTRSADEILFCSDGGIDVGNVEEKAVRMLINDSDYSENQVNSQLIEAKLLSNLPSSSANASPVLPAHKSQVMASFLANLYNNVFVKNHFTYLEINPVVLINEQIYILDLAAKIDTAAEYACGRIWSELAPGYCFPAPFGRALTPEEAYVASLDASTGASLKLTILNPQGRIWLMVAGGGASVAYADAVSALGCASDLANYGEYSGAPSETQTYEYARTIISLMTRVDPNDNFVHSSKESISNSSESFSHEVHENDTVKKVLIIGGGIANFTNVASTFKGIVRALTEAKDRLIRSRVALFVRRGGPNYQEGLRMMRDLGAALGIPIRVYGPETHMTMIVPMAVAALEGKANDQLSYQMDSTSLSNVSPSSFLSGSLSRTNSLNLLVETSDFSVSNSNARFASDRRENQSSLDMENTTEMLKETAQNSGSKLDFTEHSNKLKVEQMFTRKTRAIVYGMQQKAVQGMLDFDYVSRRETPSVAAIVHPFGGGDHALKFYWGTGETMIPVYTSVTNASSNHPDASIVVNFASFRSAPSACEEIIEQCPKIKTIAVIAEGIPERNTRCIIALARRKNVNIIGPATVGGCKAGAFRIGNSGGMMDNVLACKLYRPGSICYVSRSGGMSNELNNILTRTTDGVLEGIAIGGDRYPGSSFAEHLLRMHANPECKMLVLLGEVGGTEELEICDLLKSGHITKPLVAWCIGVCAGMFQSEVQFGHAGAVAGCDQETAIYKNSALSSAGAIVPSSFEGFSDAIATTYRTLLEARVIVPAPEPERPQVPIDYAWAQELGLIRKPAAFVSTICDDRGQELLYAGVPISAVFKEDLGIGGVLSLLWFRRRLPVWATRFIEMVLMLTADHGPAVSGAHNTIVAARAGKDLVSSLASGLLTIGDRFGGALDGAASQFTSAFDQLQTPSDFVAEMRKKNTLIQGIGHRIKSKTNPDQRVSILISYAHEHFPCTPLLDYALRVEEITVSKKENLILNVDGATAVLFVDLLRHSGAFTRAEADEYVKIGALNGLFVLGRSMGFIGHYIDQKRLKQGLYRHPWDDISYLAPATTEQPRYAN